MLIDKIDDKSAEICVMGLGYVGLPLAVSFAQAGFKVTGYDIDGRKVTLVNSAKSYIPGVTNVALREIINSNKFCAVNDLPWSWNIDAVIICVPTPVDDYNEPDISLISKAVDTIKTHLNSREVLVVIESSTYPDTTREITKESLSHLVKYVAYSPERVDPGNKVFTLKNTPKLIGGIDVESALVAHRLYSSVVDNPVIVPKPEVAELAKLYENVFRSVNIALANELAVLCGKMDVSVWDVLEAAKTKPFGYMPFRPSLGVGGHCIPINPYYLMFTAERYDTSLNMVKNAVDVNKSMPEYVSEQIEKLLCKYGKKLEGAKILILGVAFKKNVSDIRGSPSLVLSRLLNERGASVDCNDPHTIAFDNILDKYLENADCVVIAVDHDCFNYKHIIEKSKLIYDTCGITYGLASDKIHRLGEKID